MIKKALIIGDPHSDPKRDNRRFDWLGNLILEEGPDLVLCTGDFAELHSLSSYDKGKKSGEGSLYKDDVDACLDALYRISKPIGDYNIKRRLNKKSSRPKVPWYMLGGNHEDRIRRAVNDAPNLHGTVSLKDLCYAGYGWNYIPFLEEIVIEQTVCCHYFPTGVSGAPISGFSIASNAVLKNLASSICGHSHLLDFSVSHSSVYGRINGLCAGCYVEEKTFDFATYKYWWSGLCILHDWTEGRFDLETIEISRVRSLYG